MKIGKAEKRAYAIFFGLSVPIGLALAVVTGRHEAFVIAPTVIALVWGVVYQMKSRKHG